MCLISTGECVAANFGLRRQLRDDGKDEVTTVLLIFIAEVAIKISNDRRSCFVLCYDVFNNPRTEQNSECMQTRTVESDKPQHAFAGSRYKMGVRGARSSRTGKGRTFPVDPQERRRLLPLFEYTSLEEPRCGSLVVSLACYIVVGRGVRR
jgi:hypothetical protein